MLKGRYGVGWMVAAWLVLAALLIAASLIGLWVGALLFGPDPLSS